MNKAATNRQIMETYYKSINQGDFDTVINLMSEDVVFHMIGTGPFSGRWEGRDRVYGELVPSVMKSFKPETVEFAGKWKIMCADEERAVGLMTGKAETTEGTDFETTYCQIFKIENSNLDIKIFSFITIFFVGYTVFSSSPFAGCIELAIVGCNKSTLNTFKISL